MKLNNKLALFLSNAFGLVCFIISIALLPVTLSIGTYLHFSRRDRFRCLARFCGVNVVPAFGLWCLPTVYKVF